MLRKVNKSVRKLNGFFSQKPHEKSTAGRSWPIGLYIILYTHTLAPSIQTRNTLSLPKLS